MLYLAISWLLPIFTTRTMPVLCMICVTFGSLYCIEGVAKLGSNYDTASCSIWWLLVRSLWCWQCRTVDISQNASLINFNWPLSKNRRCRRELLKLTNHTQYENVENYYRVSTLSPAHAHLASNSLTRYWGSWPGLPHLIVRDESRNNSHFFQSNFSQLIYDLDSKWLRHSKSKIKITPMK